MRAMASYETRRFSRAEYERLIDLGVFQPGEAIELIGGDLMVAEPQNAAHYTAIMKTARALAGRADYWILNLVGRVLEVYREPAPDPAAPFGWRYARSEMLDASTRVTPLAAPGSSISVSRFLP